MFKKAERHQSKLRLALTGTSGSGKTYSALQIAQGMGGKVAVIDTEHGSASLYANRFDFDVAELQAPYTVDKYVSALQDASKNGYKTIVIDSLTHVWASDGGLLAIKDKLSETGAKNSYYAWKSVTPLYNKLIDSVLQSPIHVIATIRSKTDYAVQVDDKGRATPVKIGLAPVQRDGIEYEFTTVLDLSSTHFATASKDRTGLFATNNPFQITSETGLELMQWLQEGGIAHQALREDDANVPGDMAEDMNAEMKKLLDTREVDREKFMEWLGYSPGIEKIEAGIKRLRAKPVRGSVQGDATNT